MDKDSKIIKLLRFPLAILVVLLHAEPSIVGWNPQNMTSENIGANIAGCIMYSLSHVLAQIAVPTFFLISGYLFFSKLENWNTHIWKRKLISRFSSIVIPYIICIAIFSLRHLLSHYKSGDLAQWLESQGGLLNLFWSSEHWRAGQNNIFGQAIVMSGPAAYHLWFLRDLIISVLLTPIFYAMFAMNDDVRRKVSIFWLILFCLLDLTRVQIPVPGLNCSTMFYFGLGSYLSLNKMDLSSTFYKSRYTLAASFVLLYLCLIPLDGSRTQTGTYIMPIENLLGVICVINLASFFTTSKFSKDFLYKYEKTSFFMFIIHPFFLALVWRASTVIINSLYCTVDVSGLAFVNSHPLLTLFLFFTKIIITAALSVLTYHTLTHLTPYLSKLICGR